MSKTRLVHAALSMALAVVLCGCHPRTPPIETGPGSTNSARAFLFGRWSLMSFEVFPPDQPPINVKGSAGTLTYDEYGNLAVEIRVDEATAEAFRTVGIPTDKGTISTTGRTVVNMQAHTLTYMLKGQPAFGTPSGPLALNRPRYWQVDGAMLTLTTKSDSGQPLSVGTWQKIQ